jgi:hypothetical protein
MIVAGFRPTSGWAGRTVAYENGVFVLQDHGPVTAGAVLAYDRQGHLLWASEGLRDWVQKMAAATGGSMPKSEPQSTCAEGGEPRARAARLSKAEKKAAKAAKKRRRELEEFKRRHDLEGLQAGDLEVAGSIAHDLAALGVPKASSPPRSAKAVDQATVGYLSAACEQNWLIIKLLGDIKYLSATYEQNWLLIKLLSDVKTELQKLNRSSLSRTQADPTD